MQRRPWINESGTYLVLNKYLQMNEGLNSKKISMIETQKTKGSFLAGDIQWLTFEFDFEEWVNFL